MFKTIEKSDTRILVEVQFTKETPVQLEITARTKEQCVYLFIQHLNLYVESALDMIVQECETVKKGFHDLGYGSILNQKQSVDWWDFLEQKSRWAKLSNSKERYQRILAYNFTTVCRFGQNVEIMVHELQKSCVVGIKTHDFYNQNYLQPFLDSLQKQAI